MAKIREERNRRSRPARLVSRAALTVAILAIGIIVGGSSSSVVASQEPPSPGKGKKYIATRDITVDKATGALRKPTAPETQELVDTLTRMLKPSSDQMTAVTLPNGATVMNVEGRFAPVMLARPNADGTTAIRCVTTLDEALDFLGLEEGPAQQ